MAMLEKSFNQIDEDKHSQHYATLNRGRRGGCFNDLCHWLYMIYKHHISLKIIMKLRDISKRLVAVKIKSYMKAYFAYAIPTDIFTEHALISSLNGRLIKKYSAVKMREQQ